jgi:hypothetical protein
MPQRRPVWSGAPRAAIAGIEVVPGGDFGRLRWRELGQIRRASVAPARSHQLFQGHVKDILSLFAKTVIKFDGTAIFRAVATKN